MKKSITKCENYLIGQCLKSWYDLATDEQILLGKQWYGDAQDYAKYLSMKYNIELYVCATVISCLSPNNKWERNKIDAENVIKAWIAGIPPESIKVCTYNANKVKAFLALDGQLISEKSPKTHAFAMNVGLKSADHITIDKWHLRACMFTPDDGIKECVESCTIVQYRRVEKITAQLAQELNLKGYELQAIIWVTIKNNWGR